MKITQKLLNELCYLISNTSHPNDLKGKKAVIFRTAKGLRDAIYAENLKDKNLLELPYYGKIEELADEFLDEYWKEWKEDTGEWGLKSNGEGNFYQWYDYDGKIHEWVDSNFYSFDADEILDNSNEVEDDWGLWDGEREWWKINETIAFFTLKRDLGFEIMDKAKILAEKENISIDKIE